MLKSHVALLLHMLVAVSVMLLVNDEKENVPPQAIPFFEKELF